MCGKAGRFGFFGTDFRLARLRRSLFRDGDRNLFKVGFDSKTR
jgi:hypothetical protein